MRPNRRYPGYREGPDILGPLQSVKAPQWHPLPLAIEGAERTHCSELVRWSALYLLFHAMIGVQSSCNPKYQARVLYFRPG